MLTERGWRAVGVPRARFYLTGRVVVEGRRLVDPAALPGRQGGLLLVYLLANRHRPIPVDELAAALWGDELPRIWEPSLRVTMSKLRSVLDEVGATGLRREAGCYLAELGHAWIGLEAAANPVDRAEALRADGRLRALLAEELGTSPSPETQELFAELPAVGSDSPLPQDPPVGDHGTST